MTLDFSAAGSVFVILYCIVTGGVCSNWIAVTPAEEWLFDIRDSLALSGSEHMRFHSAVAKLGSGTISLLLYHF